MGVGILTALIAVLTTSAVIFFKWSFNYWKRKNVYSIKPSIPFGNFKDVFLRKITIGELMHNVYHELKFKGLRYGGIYMFVKPVFVIIDLDLIRNVLNKDFEHFMDHDVYINEETDPKSGNLFNLKGAKWKALRAKLTPTFTSGKLKMMFGTLIDCTKYLPKIIDEFIADKQPIDIKDTFARYSTDVVGSVGFGIECNCLKDPDTEFRLYVKRAFELGPIKAAKVLLSTIIPNFFRFFKIPTSNTEVLDFFGDIVKGTIEYREKNKVDRNDFMKLLMELKSHKFSVDLTGTGNQKKNETSFYQDGLSLNEIVAQAAIFFFAGFESPSTTLTFCMLELSRNLEIQQKLREDIIAVLEKHGGEITYEAIHEIAYLDKCVNETLRKYPPGATLNRECTKAYRVPGSNLIIPKGSSIFLPVYGIHRDPEYYPDPEKFDPERFSEENKKKRHPYAYLPFGEGPRICIGMRFGLIQVKIGIATLLRNYRFTLNEKTKLPVEFDPKKRVVSAKGGVWLNAERI